MAIPELQLLETETAPKRSPASIETIFSQAETRQRKKRKLYLCCAVLALVLVGAATAVRWQTASADAPSYKSEAARIGDLSIDVTAVGFLQPTEQIDVSSELSGIVRDVNVDYNSIVSPGEVLAVLDTNKLDADVKSAEANLESAKANVLKAEAQVKQSEAALSRQRSLRRVNASTQQNLDDAQFNYDSAAATLQSSHADMLVAEANLRLADVNLSKAKIVSPVQGVVLTRSINPGATVAASFSAPVLFTIAGDLRKMELRVDVNEADIGQVTIGQQANFTVEAYPDRVFPAEIKQVRYASDTTNNVVTYKAVLSVENPDLALRPGMTATADIVAKSIKNVLLVPNAALRYVPPSKASSQTTADNAKVGRAALSSKRHIWTLHDGQLRQTDVEIGASDGKWTQIVSGNVHAGDTVVFDSSNSKS